MSVLFLEFPAISLKETYRLVWLVVSCSQHTPVLCPAGGWLHLKA